MALRQAEHLCPQATFLPPDPESAARLRELISSALYDLAPVVEVRVEGIAWLDVSGVRRVPANRFAKPGGGCAPPSAASLGSVLRQDLSPPDSPRRRARPGRLMRVDDARGFLAPLPSRELPLDAEQLERLDLLGLRTLGAVAAIGPRELESQLGRDGRHAVLLARGVEPDQLDAMAPSAFHERAPAVRAAGRGSRGAAVRGSRAVRRPRR